MKFLVLNNPHCGKCMECSCLPVDDKATYDDSEVPEIKCSDWTDTN